MGRSPSEERKRMTSLALEENHPSSSYRRIMRDGGGCASSGKRPQEKRSKKRLVGGNWVGEKQNPVNVGRKASRLSLKEKRPRVL